MFTLPSIAIGTVDIEYRDGFERKHKEGTVIGTESAVNDPEFLISSLKETLIDLKIKVEDVLSVKITGRIIDPPEELTNLFNDGNPSDLPVTDGLTVESIFRR